jgi:hypothetical protein
MNEAVLRIDAGTRKNGVMELDLWYNETLWYLELCTDLGDVGTRILVSMFVASYLISH